MADRTIDEVRKRFLELHREAGALAKDTFHLRPSWRLLFFRKRLYQLEERIDSPFTAFMTVDGELSRACFHSAKGYQYIPDSDHTLHDGFRSAGFSPRASVRHEWCDQWNSKSA
jgi:hypothetical protein